MAESRFDQYVRETLADSVKTRRDELAAAVEKAKAELAAKVKAAEKVVDEACAEADKKIRALAKKWGWKPVPGSEGSKIVEARCLSSSLESAFEELRTIYECYGRCYAAGPVAAAQRALAKFDEAVEKAARRLVVVKKDLGMKAGEFDEAMADAVAKLLK